jgi:hypothetical protein
MPVLDDFAPFRDFRVQESPESAGVVAMVFCALREQSALASGVCKLATASR